MKYDKPCLKGRWRKAFFMSDNNEHIVLDGIEMTAKNIWDMAGSREKLLEKLVDYFYVEGFKPFDAVAQDSLENAMSTLIKENPNSAIGKDGSLLNSSYFGLDICKAFCQTSFYSTSVDGKPSIAAVYKSKDLLRKVLQSMMGWNTTICTTTGSDGKLHEEELPYLIDISHKALVNECYSSMTSINVPCLKSCTAKFLMDKFCTKGGKVLDLSAGWGTRMMAAIALGLEYYGIDPMTAKDLERLWHAIEECSCMPTPMPHASLIEGVSEDSSFYDRVPNGIDYVIACPPQFKFEDYDCAASSTRVYGDYHSWLEDYWHKSIINAKAKMRTGSKLSLVMVVKWKNYSLLEDMSKVLVDEGFKLVDELSYKIPHPHTSNARLLGMIDKNVDKVRTFELV